MSIRAVTLFLFLILTLEAKERIISLSPSLSEILFALGAGDRVVGVSAYSLYPKEAQKLPIVGSYMQPNLEKIIALSPTLVIGQEYTSQINNDLKKFHIPTLNVSLQRIQNIKTSITTLARELHLESHAKVLIDDIDSAIRDAKTKQKSHSVLIVYGLNEDLRSGIYVAGHDIFFDDIITLSGHTNAYTGSLTAQPVLNYENVIALNPDQIIILHSHKSAPDTDVKKALANWYRLPCNASKKRRISIVDADYIHIPSHRVALSIRRLSQEMRYD